MEAFSPITEDDEREDGEIVDNDFTDFEEITNYSMPPYQSGKSDYNQDLYRAISLSSISDSDNECTKIRSNYNKSHSKRYDDYLSFKPFSKDVYSEAKRATVNTPRAVKPRKTSTRKLKSKLKRLKKELNKSSNSNLRNDRKRRPSTPSSSIASVDKRTLQKLKEAIRIDDCNGADSVEHHNSLKNRLKCMLGQENKDSQAMETDCSDCKQEGKEPAQDMVNKVSNTDENANESEEENIDLELAELRLEALKSAMLQKAKERKNRLIKAESQPSEPCSTFDKINGDSLNNKENKITEIVEDSKSHSKNSEKVPESPSVEEDVDIMRAMLLASMSKKITNLKIVEKETVVLNTSVLQNKQILSNSLPGTKVIDSKSSFSSVNNLNAPQILPPVLSIKPIIIRVNNDSDSDSDLDEFDGDKPAPSVETVRRKDSVQQPIVRSVDELLRKQREQFEAKLKLQDKTNKDNKLLEKSGLELLPKEQQQEYQQLKKKLIILRRERRKNVQRKLSTSAGHSNTSQIKTNVLPKKAIGQNLSQSVQNQRDRRLHMKGKYRELAPLLKNVNAASTAKKQCEDRVKSILKDLRDAKAQLADHTQKYSTLVRKLAAAKSAIDRRYNKPTSNQPMKNEAPIANATAIVNVTNNIMQKDPHFKAKSNISKFHFNNIAITETPVSLMPIVPLVPPSAKAEIHQPINNTHLNEENKVANYVSPLDNRKTERASNPLELLCPYELFGVCKDKNCTFNHCPM